MKKIYCLIMIFFLLMLNNNIIYADNQIISQDDIFISNEDYNEVDKDVFEAIDADLNGAEAFFDKGVKVYIDTNVIKLQTSNSNDILNALKESEYVWVIPFVLDGEYGQITLGRGMPLDESVADILSDEEKEQIIANEGRWTITEERMDTVGSYYDTVAQLEPIDGAQKVIFVGSQPGMSMPMGLILGEMTHLLGYH